MGCLSDLCERILFTNHLEKRDCKSQEQQQNCFNLHYKMKTKLNTFEKYPKSQNVVRITTLDQGQHQSDQERMGWKWFCGFISLGKKVYVGQAYEIGQGHKNRSWSSSRSQSKNECEVRICGFRSLGYWHCTLTL